MKDFSEKLKQRISPLYDSYNDEAFASVAVVFLKAQSLGPGLVLIERAHHPQDPWSGHMGLPGGRSEAQELPHQTASRECFEELKLQISGQHAIGRLDRVRAVGKGRFQDFHVLPHLFFHHDPWEKVEKTLDPDPREVQNFMFVSFDELLNPENHALFQLEEGRFSGQNLPYFDLQGRKVWGLTYHILGEVFKSAQGLKYLSAEGLRKDVDASFWGRFPKS